MEKKDKMFFLTGQWEGPQKHFSEFISITKIYGLSAWETIWVERQWLRYNSPKNLVDKGAYIISLSQIIHPNITFRWHQVVSLLLQFFLHLGIPRKSVQKKYQSITHLKQNLKKGFLNILESNDWKCLTVWMPAAIKSMMAAFLSLISSPVSFRIDRKTASMLSSCASFCCSFNVVSIRSVIMLK